MYFVKFKLLCDELMVTLNTENVKKLKNLIETTNSSDIASVKEVLIIPLLIGLQRTDLTCCLKESILDTFHVIFTHVNVTTVREFIKLYTLVFDQLSSDPTAIVNASDELKDCVLRVAMKLIEKLIPNLFTDLYISDFVPPISYGVFIALELAKNERRKNTRLLALEFLLKISQYEHPHNAQLDEQVAHVFMLFLPGILSGLKDIICRDERQHHEVVQMSVKYLGHILGLVLKDFQRESTILKDIDVVSSWLNGLKKKEPIDNTDKILKETVRSEKWVEAAVTTMESTLVSIFSKRLHSHSRVRLEFATAMNILLEQCPRNLGKSVIRVLEVLLSLLDDDDISVREAAHVGVQQFKELCNNNNNFSFIIQESFHQLLISLPKRIMSANDDEILLNIRLLRNYMDIFQGCHVLYSPVYIQKIIYILQITSKFELCESYLEMDWNQEVDTSKDWKKYKYYQSKMITEEFKKICSRLPNIGDMDMVADCLIEDCCQKNYKIESLNVLNYTLTGWSNPKNHLLCNIMDFYLGVNNENAVVPWKADVTIQEKKQNILQEALLVEGLGKLSKVVDSDSSQFLLKTLYFVLERMGSSYKIIKYAAVNAAEEIATAFKFVNVTALIENNIDYLTHHVSMRLKKTEASAFIVVHIIIENSPAEALPSLQDIVDKILSTSSERFNPSTIIPYLKVFKTFLEYITRVYPSPAQTKLEKPTPGHLQCLIDFINKREDLNETENDLDDTNENDSCDKDDDFDKKEELPNYAKMTIAVIRRCLHYLPSKDDERKILTLEVLNRGLLIIAQWENELLPLVHEIWSPLVKRFDANVSPLIINRSFALLLTMTRLAKDFIRSRTLKEILPSLRTFLINSARKSRGKDSGSAYYTTQQFKLQMELLNGLGPLAIDLQLREREIYNIMDAAQPYLSLMQPQLLQVGSIELYKHLFEYDPTAVEYHLSPLKKHQEFAKCITNIIPD